MTYSEICAKPEHPMPSVARLMRAVLRGIADPLRRARRLWLAFAWLLSGFLVVTGSVFLAGANKLVVATQAFVVLVEVPGGLRTHGFIMLLLGLVVAGSLMGRSRGALRITWVWLSNLLMIVAFYFLWTAFAYGLAGAVTGGKSSWLGVITWGTLAAWPVILRVLPPPAHGRGEDAQLIAAAHQAGIGPEQALALASIYLHGGEPGEPR